MSDLINRQDAIDAIIKKLCIKSEAYLLESEKAIVDVIKDLPSANQWIPVSERLPEKEFNLYIVTYKMSAEDFRTGISDFCYGTWAVRPHGEVIAWMPLPNPYKETEE